MKTTYEALYDCQVAEYMNPNDHLLIARDLKEAFLDEKACLKVNGNSVCLDDFIGVYLPESGAYINACKNITKGYNLTQVFHNVLDSLIDENLRTLSYQEIAELFE
jgi:hypothetical protein